MERMFKVVTNKINNERMLLEDELEKLINSPEPLKETADEIVDVLKKIASNNSTGEMWQSYLTNIINDNTKKNE